ncbi:hypothetical protein TSAR_009360 [Trichomalopsis sarcophagae]|uniref:Uncharacterized protein n=1 Tax=Trichomalopsis sarcophagae TaxID=543379 RepID=A0A232EVA6_9HYME|nr:hypothetical protein TSAR_009360 [Trichomalopsis sarcophagae]
MIVGSLEEKLRASDLRIQQGKKRRRLHNKIIRKTINHFSWLKRRNGFPMTGKTTWRNKTSRRGRKTSRGISDNNGKSAVQLPKRNEPSLRVYTMQE